ncbi:hypothetical protein I79_007457 [Cricetulus griseus]|uniref:Uncharacterized protein n=1 Tax=Cricetulus griseus TaxID=10029 RepID=G3HAK1_CRIGR|nr:hypothetical protein I79_007457 [Cricetulus griseus]
MSDCDRSPLLDLLTPAQHHSFSNHLMKTMVACLTPQRAADVGSQTLQLPTCSCDGFRGYVFSRQ